MGRLVRAQAVLCIIDVQERLLPVMSRATHLVQALERLAAGTRVLGVPLIVTEQYVKGLGATVAPLRQAMGSAYHPVEKTSFSSFASAEFREAMGRSGGRQILLAGIETHVCVYQTAMDLLANDYEVHLVVDAVSSRTEENREIAIRRLVREGAKLTSVEMALFEMTVASGTDEFRAISKIVK